MVRVPSVFWKAIRTKLHAHSNACLHAQIQSSHVCVSLVSAKHARKLVGFERVDNAFLALELKNAALEFRDLLLKNLRAAFLPSIVIFALLGSVRLDALSTCRFCGIAFLESFKREDDDKAI